MTISNAISKKSDTALKTIGEVAKITNIAPHIIRFWENKFVAIKPFRNRGRRYFNQQNIDKIIKIKELLYSENYSIKSVQNYFNKAENMKENNKTKKKTDNKEQLERIRDRLIELRDKLLSFN